jgi:glutathione S-transferase
MNDLLEFWQAEWCPHSHRVRLRLTELGVPFLARQISVGRDERDDMAMRTGLRSIPTLVDGDTIIHGADEILAHLNARHPEPIDATRHRAMMRDEWPHWRELHDT